jgi:hypothetical protein
MKSYIEERDEIAEVAYADAAKHPTQLLKDMADWGAFHSPIVLQLVEALAYYSVDLPWIQTTETRNWCGDDCAPTCNEHSEQVPVKIRSVAHSKDRAVVAHDAYHKAKDEVISEN